MTDLAARLLDAHVQHTLKELDGDRLVQLIGSEVGLVLEAAEGLTLDQAVTRDAVKAVAIKYVATFRLPGAIPEIAGDIAARVRTHAANEVLLGDLIGRAKVEELVAIFAEMRTLRTRVLRGLADSAALQAGVGDVVYGFAAGAFGASRRIIGRVPIVRTGVTVAEAVTAPLVTPLVAALDQRSRELAERGARVLLAYLGDNAAGGVSDEELRIAVLEVWDALSGRPLGDLLGVMSEDQLSGIFVALYEIWLELRASDYIAAVVIAGIDIFYDTYGGVTLAALLAEFGLGPDDLVEEALRFAPTFLDAARDAGLLEPALRRHLARFYNSAEAQALLATS